MDDEDLGFFYDDAIDQLQFMESALLDAQDGTDDEEKIGEIFRAMHTIKGTAGMFGFDDIVSLTHKAENLLDEVRNKTVELTSNLASLFMSVKDATSALVENVVNAQELDDDIKNSLTYLENELLKNMPNSDSNSNTQKEITKDEVEDESDETLWHISLRLEPEFLKSGMDIISIIKYMPKLGEILLNIPIAQDIPDIEDFDPTQAYIGFEVDFQSECPQDEIVEIFEFVEDDIDLIVFKHDDKKSCEDLFENREDGLKQKLIDEFSYEESFFEDKEIESIVAKEEVHKIKKEQVETKPLTVEIEKPKDIIIKQPKKDNDFFLKVNSRKIDEIINKVSQMVISNSQLSQYIQSKEEQNENEDEDLQEMLSGISTLLEDVRTSVMDVRMVQVKDSFIKYRRIVSDTASKLNKQIDFILEGEDTELDKSVVEKLSDPLTHMIRNSVDHGVETPEIRISKGKDPKGTVILRAYPDAGTIVIELEDDGAGINKEAVLNKAILNGIVSADNNLSDQEIYMLIFSAGLSTAQNVSNISGRGVGMDVVRRNIEDLRGVIEVDSTKDKGSKITVRLPLTLAIIDGFLVQSGHSKFIIPVEMITQCIELTDEYKSDIEGANTIKIRGEVLPLLNLRKFYNDQITSDELEINEDDEEYRQNVVIVRFGNSDVGLLVDELFGQQQTVIKPLGSIFQQIPGISGGSILGSGEIAYILDIPKLIENKIKQGV